MLPKADAERHEGGQRLLQSGPRPDIMALACPDSRTERTP